MRQFTIINGNGERYSLNEPSHFLDKPQNLGAKFNSKYQQLDSTFIRTARIARPDDIKGEIVFTGDYYGQYFRFIKSLAVEPLKLEYVSNGTYYADVDLKEIDKSEVSDGMLKCSIKFKRLSRWYRNETHLNDRTVESGKVYDYTFPYTYTADEPEVVTITSDSGYSSPTKITIFGPCTNPEWTHYLNGNIIETGKVTATVRTGRRLVIDCTKVPYSIKEIGSDGTIYNDLYQYSDFTKERFFHLQYGQNRIVVGHSGSNKLSLAVEAHIEYETV